MRARHAYRLPPGAATDTSNFLVEMVTRLRGVDQLLSPCMNTLMAMTVINQMSVCARENICHAFFKHFFIYIFCIFFSFFYTRIFFFLFDLQCFSDGIFLLLLRHAFATMTVRLILDIIAHTMKTLNFLCENRPNKSGRPPHNGHRWLQGISLQTNALSVCRGLVHALSIYYPRCTLPTASTVITFTHFTWRENVREMHRLPTIDAERSSAPVPHTARTLIFLPLKPNRNARNEKKRPPETMYLYFTFYWWQ